MRHDYITWTIISNIEALFSRVLVSYTVGNKIMGKNNYNSNVILLVKLLQITKFSQQLFCYFMENGFDFVSISFKAFDFDSWIKYTIFKVQVQKCLSVFLFIWSHSFYIFMSYLDCSIASDWVSPILIDC